MVSDAVLSDCVSDRVKPPAIVVSFFVFPAASSVVECSDGGCCGPWISASVVCIVHFRRMAHATSCVCCFMAPLSRASTLDGPLPQEVSMASLDSPQCVLIPPQSCTAASVHSRRSRNFQADQATSRSVPSPLLRLIRAAPRTYKIYRYPHPEQHHHDIHFLSSHQLETTARLHQKSPFPRRKDLTSLGRTPITYELSNKQTKVCWCAFVFTPLTAHS